MAPEEEAGGRFDELGVIVAQAISPRANHFRQRLRKVAAAATDTIRFGPVEPGWRYALYYLAVESNSSGATQVRAYVSGHGYDHYFFEQKTPAANTLYFSSDDFFLEEGEELVFEWQGLTVGNIISAYLNGFYTAPEKK